MKTAKEGRPRRLHRLDWPGFLNRLLPPVVWQGFGAQAGQSERRCGYG